MLIGTADVDALGRAAPTLTAFDTSPLALEDVETLLFFSEIERAGSDGLVPPGLHPTLPPAVTWLVQRFPKSPWGSFCLAQCRIECRSGLRPRGFLRGGLIDNATAAAALEAQWGFALGLGDVDLSRGYDRVRATVDLEGRRVLVLALGQPSPLAPGDIHYMASMHLAQTPRGLRLVQVDPEFQVTRAECGEPLLLEFDAEAWRSPGLCPSLPGAASFSIATLVLPALRFVCRADQLAFQGTEKLDA